MSKKELIRVFNYLMKYFNNENVTWECLYLYKYLVEVHREDCFYEKINKLPKNISESLIKEYVKAETHDIDMKYLFNVINIKKVIELRRFLEDIDVKSDVFEESYSIYMEMAKHPFIRSNVLYELRRFLKYNYSIEMLYVLRVLKGLNFSVCNSCKISVCNDWKILNLILEKCIAKEDVSFKKIEDILIEYYTVSETRQKDIIFSSYLI